MTLFCHYSYSGGLLNGTDSLLQVEVTEHDHMGVQERTVKNVSYRLSRDRQGTLRLSLQSDMVTRKDLFLVYSVVYYILTMVLG